MATFRVGQRVKLVRPIHGCNMNATGSIRALYGWWYIFRKNNCEIAWDTEAELWSAKCHTSRLVPAAPPDTYRKTTWAECPWVPPHLRETV